jgi:hypothetical protein
MPGCDEPARNRGPDESSGACYERNHIHRPANFVSALLFAEKLIGKIAVIATSAASPIS